VTNIINGQDVSSPGKYPWQVSLQKPTSSRFHFCGASVISNKWVLTAAHCVKGSRPSSLLVVVGLHDQRRKYGKPAEYTVKRIIAHPRYSSRTISFDIAVIEVQGSIQSNDFVQPIALATHREFGPSAQCVISGWGRTSGSSNRAPDVLQETSATIVDAEKCKQTQRKEDVICLFNGKSGSCNGDSGGPLACKSGSTWKLAGATSYGQRNCPVNRAYSVYADVGYFNKWVMQSTDNLSGGGGDGGDGSGGDGSGGDGSGGDGSGGDGSGGDGGSCDNSNKYCASWASYGYCAGKNQPYMQKYCKKACKSC